MAVMTPLDTKGAAAILQTYGLALIDLAPTSAGIENTNYFVTAIARDALTQDSVARNSLVTDFISHDPAAQNSTRSGRPLHLVLTILESPQRPDGNRTPTPFVPHLLEALTRAGLPVPTLQRTTANDCYAGFADKPVLLCARLPGEHPVATTLTDCAAIGRFLARMHRAATTLLDTAPAHPRQADWLFARANELRRSLPSWQAALINEGVGYVTALQRRADYHVLPEAVVHGDLFRDNALFAGTSLTGVIDFHHAARHKRLFDIAVAINDWCTALDNAVDDARAFALMAGYQSVTPLMLVERLLLPGLLAYAALAFSLSRLHAAWLDAEAPNKSALPMLLKLHRHLRAPWYGGAGLDE